MIYRDVDISCSTIAYVVAINDVYGDHYVYTFIAMGIDLQELRSTYTNAYYRFLTVDNYMALPK